MRYRTDGRRPDERGSACAATIESRARVSVGRRMGIAARASRGRPVSRRPPGPSSPPAPTACARCEIRSSAASGVRSVSRFGARSGSVGRGRAGLRVLRARRVADGAGGSRGRARQGQGRVDRMAQRRHTRRRERRDEIRPSRRLLPGGGRGHRAGPSHRIADGGAGDDQLHTAAVGVQRSSPAFEQR